MTEVSGAGADLQFETAIPKAAGVAGAVACRGCSRPITSTYYDVSGQTTCAECRTKIGALLETPRGAAPLVKAGLFGAGAGIAGAIVYYGVIAITHFEIGIVAILIGYMVGYAVRKGAGGGGRRFQVLAIALTYAAVALAYTPIVVKAAIDANRKTAQSPAAAADAQAPESEARTRPSPALAIATLLGLIAALPVVVVVGGLPSSIISAAIIFFGMRQAWKMTGTPALVITGPYRVGTPPAVPV